MLVGALTGGAIADRLDRRRTIVVSVLWFSLSGWAPAHRGESPRRRCQWGLHLPSPCSAHG
jgi:MFS family permease